jgi:hypothetical protein
MDTNINSGQIEIKGPYGSVFLYTHDLAHNILNTVHKTLSKKVNWDDPDYLARTLFCKLVPEEFWNSDKGFGIGTQMYHDIKLLITIDTVLKRIIITNFEMQGSVNRSLHYDFDKFIENFTDGAKL